MKSKYNHSMFGKAAILGLLVLLWGSLAIVAAQARRPVEIVYLSAGTTATEADWNKKWVGVWNAQNPDIQVRLETASWPELFAKIAAYTAAGTPPDMGWYGPSQMFEFQKMGILEPLDQWLGAAKGEYLPPILDPKVSDVIFDGRMYGAPFTYVGNNLAARADALIEAGISPGSLITWDGFRKAAEAVNSPPKRYATYFTFGDPLRAAFQGTFYITGFGPNSIVDFRPEQRANYIRALTYINSLFPYMPESMVSWKYADALQAYQNGLVALHITGSFLLGELGRTAPELMTPSGTYNLPWPATSGRGRIPLYTVGYVMFKGSKYKAETAKVIQFLTQQKALYEWPMNMNPKRGMTILERSKVNEFGPKLNWYLGAWDDMLRNARTFRRIQYTPADEINTIFRDALLAMYQKKATPTQTYDQLRSKITALGVETK
jgi:putative chitobiose transport system substrate-binding protein